MSWRPGSYGYHAAVVFAGRQAPAISWRKYVTPSCRENRPDIRNAAHIQQICPFMSYRLLERLTAIDV